MLDTGQDIRSNWTVDEVEALLRLPLLDLVGRANTIHRTYHDPEDIQKASLLSIKTGSCQPPTRAGAGDQRPGRSGRDVPRQSGAGEPEQAL